MSFHVRNTIYEIVPLLLLSISVGFNVLIANAEVSNKEDIHPTDVVSVSKFIKDFQRQIDGDAVHIGKSELSLLGDYSAKLLQQENEFHNESYGMNSTSGANNKNSSTLIKCLENESFTLSVELVNSTRLSALLAGNPNVTSRITPAKCLVLLFYARICPFSCLAAPHFNALARAFPTIKVVAINALSQQSFNTQFGIGGVPTVMLFHNGRPAAKFNESEYTLEMFSRFITRFTGLKPVERMFVTSGDFGGPVPSVLVKETDYWLGIAWIIVLATIAMMISKSQSWKIIMEFIHSAWNEAQAEHEHIE